MRESHDVMRSDMYKIIVERPRRSKDLKARALRFRNSLDGPSHLGMRVAYGYRELNENLAPLRRGRQMFSAKPTTCRLQPRSRQVAAPT